jgi:hypothetical protein
MGVNNMKKIITTIFALFTVLGISSALYVLIDYMKFCKKIMNDKDDVEYVTPKMHSIDIDV